MSDLIKNINHQDTTLNDDDSSTTVENMEEETTSSTSNASEGSTILTTEPRHVETSTPTKSELTPSSAQEHTTMGTTIAAVTVTPGREKSAVTNRYYYRHYSFLLTWILVNFCSTWRFPRRKHGRRRPITRKRARVEKKQQGTTTEVDTRVVVPSGDKEGKEKGSRTKEKFVWDTTIANI